MVAAAARGADGPALAVAACALIAVPIGWWLRSAAVAAVLLAVATIALADPAPMFTAVAGLCAAGYLALHHGAGRTTVPTALFAVGFAVTAATVVALPVALPWLPLAAPLVLLGALLAALWPYLALVSSRSVPAGADRDTAHRIR
ncbi:hypothetical protein JDV09_06220 [Mycobacterium sp. Y57]|nr:hypothetical protein [Mycolicibacterium xanthum]